MTLITHVQRALQAFSYQDFAVDPYALAHSPQPRIIALFENSDTARKVHLFLMRAKTSLPNPDRWDYVFDREGLQVSIVSYYLVLNLKTEFLSAIESACMVVAKELALPWDEHSRAEVSEIVNTPDIPSGLEHRKIKKLLDKFPHPAVFSKQVSTNNCLAVYQAIDFSKAQLERNNKIALTTVANRDYLIGQRDAVLEYINGIYEDLVAIESLKSMCLEKARLYSRIIPMNSLPKDLLAIINPGMSPIYHPRDIGSFVGRLVVYKTERPETKSFYLDSDPSLQFGFITADRSQGPSTYQLFSLTLPEGVSSVTPLNARNITATIFMRFATASEQSQIRAAVTNKKAEWPWPYTDRSPF